MVERKIFLEKINDVKEFVETLSRFEYDVDVISGRYIMNAKSILGVFSLDLTKPLIVRIHSDSCDDLLENIAPYTID